MEWIVFGFMGGMALIVAFIIGFALYRVNFGSDKDEANQGPNLQGTKNDAINTHDNMNNF